MQFSSPITRAVFFVITTSIALFVIARLIPPELLSVPVYATSGAISILIGAWRLLRKPKVDNTFHAQDNHRAANDDQKYDGS